MDNDGDGPILLDFGNYRCVKCGCQLSRQNIYAVRVKAGWKCKERGMCTWRRRRRAAKRQIAFPWDSEKDT